MKLQFMVYIYHSWVQIIVNNCNYYSQLQLWFVVTDYTFMDVLTGLCSDHLWVGLCSHHPLGRAMQWSPSGNEKNLNLRKSVGKIFMSHPIQYSIMTRHIIEK